MIGQYLSNTNESATVSISKKNLELNKAVSCRVCVDADSALPASGALRLKRRKQQDEY